MEIKEFNKHGLDSLVFIGCNTFQWH